MKRQRSLIQSIMAIMLMLGMIASTLPVGASPIASPTPDSTVIQGDETGSLEQIDDSGNPLDQDSNPDGVDETEGQDSADGRAGGRDNGPDGADQADGQDSGENDIPLPEPVKVTPRVPVVTEAVCVDGAPSTPIVAPVATEGITYAFDQDQVVAGTTLEVTASLAEGYAWDVDASHPDWTIDPVTNTATLTLNLIAPDCAEAVVESATPDSAIQVEGGLVVAAATEVQPEDPVVSQASCVGEDYFPPDIVLAETAGITYSLDPAYFAPGDSVTVVATLTGDEVWGAMPPDWYVIDDTRAGRIIELDNTDCMWITPEDPVVQQASCTGGILTDPVVTLPPNTSILTYSTPDTAVNGGVVTITATIDSASGWLFAAELSGEWTAVNPRLATLTVYLYFVDCDGTAPTASVADTAVTCGSGALAFSYDVTGGPLVMSVQARNYLGYQEIASDGAIDGIGVYNTTIPVGYLSPVRITFATSDGQIVASASVAFQCESIVVGNPLITQASCAGGVLVAPSIVLPDVEGVTFSYDDSQLVAGGSLVVVATAEDGAHELTGVMLGSGWTPNADGSLTFTVDFETVNCESGVTISGGTYDCLTGERSFQYHVDSGTVTIEIVQIDDSGRPADFVVDTITVSGDGSYSDGTFTLWTREVGVRIKDAAGETIGWYALQSVPDKCEATPAYPTVTQATCVDGVVTSPTFALPPDDEYFTYQPSYYPPSYVMPGGSATVWALPKTGIFAASGDSNWVPGGSGSVMLTVTFAVPDCSVPLELTPAIPEVEQAICLGVDQVSDPTVSTLEDTDLIHYTSEGDVVPGGTVTITATLQNESDTFADLTGTGWVDQGDGTATYTIHLDTVECETVVPTHPAKTPPVAHVTSLPKTGDGKASGSQDWGGMMLATGLAALAAAAIGFGTRKRWLS